MEEITEEFLSKASLSMKTMSGSFSMFYDLKSLPVFSNLTWPGGHPCFGAREKMLPASNQSAKIKILSETVHSLSLYYSSCCLRLYINKLTTKALMAEHLQHV